MGNDGLSATESERRKVPRRHLVFYLRVFDGMSNKVLGHLVDISEQGAMLISDGPVPENQEFRLRMRLPREISGRNELIIDATSCWCRPDSNPDFYIVGFKIGPPGKELQRNITRLVEDFSVEDSSTGDDEEPPACNLTHTRGR